MTDRLDTSLRATIALVALHPCCLCGAGSDKVGVFTPTLENSNAYGAPEGKQRFLFYAICDGCTTKPDVLEAVELLMRASEWHVLRSAA